jgi:hypothetical protein
MKAMVIPQLHSERKEMRVERRKKSISFIGF